MRAWWSLVVVAVLVGCHASEEASPTDTPPEFNWPSGTGELPAATPVTYHAGTPVVVASATIDATGGTIAGAAGTPIDGVVVTFPPGALTAATGLTLGYDNGTFDNATDKDLTNPVLVLQSDGQTVFAKPIEVRFPFTDATKVPVPYYIAPDGTLDLVHPLPIDRAASRGGFTTWHASDYTWVNKDTHSSKPVFNGFRPEVDGFAFSNTKDDTWAPNGRCWGISTFTRWYKKTHGGGLYSMFLDSVPTRTSQKVELTGQEVIATRAQISVFLYNTALQNIDQTPAILAIQDALNKGAPAVMVGLAGPKGNHAVLALGYSDNQIAVYDSNHPGVTKGIDYKMSYVEGVDSTISYGAYNYVGVWGNGELPMAEPMDLILTDANTSFHGENQTKVEITSHQPNQKVNAQDVVLEGKVHSGEVSIAEVEVTVIYPDLTTSDPQTVSLKPGDGDFSVPLKLQAGDNVVAFRTRGYVVPGEGLRVIPNDRDMGENSREPFVLTWGQQSTPDNLLSVNYSRTEILGDSRTDTTVALTAPFTYTVNPSLPKMLQSTTYPFAFDNCDGYGGCDLVRGQTYAGTIDGGWLPVQVSTYHEDRYHRDTSTGEWKLDSSTDTPSTVTCEWIGIYLFVEPGSTAGNYKYRLAMTRAGNVRCPGMHNQLPLLGLSLELTDGTVEDCQSPPRVMPASIESWAETPSGQKTLSLQGAIACDDGTNSTQETANVTLTLVPCNGAPCVLQ